MRKSVSCILARQPQPSSAPGLTLRPQASSLTSILVPKMTTTGTMPHREAATGGRAANGKRKLAQMEHGDEEPAPAVHDIYGDLKVSRLPR
jgi:hypothetical protein